MLKFLFSESTFPTIFLWQNRKKMLFNARKTHYWKLYIMDIEDNSVNEIVLPDCSNYLDPSLKIINNTVYVTYSS